MAFSEKVSEEILESKSHLRNALKYASINEKTYVCKYLSDILVELERLEKIESMKDKIEKEILFFNDNQ